MKNARSVLPESQFLPLFFGNLPKVPHPSLGLGVGRFEYIALVMSLEAARCMSRYERNEGHCNLDIGLGNGTKRSLSYSTELNPE